MLIIVELVAQYSFKQFSLNCYISPFMALEISAAVQYMKFHYSFTFSEIVPLQLR